MMSPAFANLVSLDVLGLARSEQYPTDAVQALVDGMDTPTLRVLAGEDAAQLNSWEAGNLLAQVLSELGMARPTTIQALWFVGLELTSEFLENRTSPIEYARAVCDLPFEEFERLIEFDPLIYAESEWGGPVEELERLSEGIWATAQDLVRSAPKLWTELGPRT